MDQFNLGDLVRISVRFWDETDAPFDPEMVAFKIRGQEDTIGREYPPGNPEIQHPEYGHYYVDFVPDHAGIWSYEWTGRNVVQLAEGGQFYVRRSLV